MAGAAEKLIYKGHPLPDDCPPVDATGPPEGIFLRLVRSKNITADDFRSGHAEGKKQPTKCDDCRWRACSVFAETTPTEKLADIAKYPT
jgi:hypothetical protein